MKRSILIAAALAILIAGVFYLLDRPHGAETVTLLRIGVLPDESPSVLERRYKPLIDYLESKTGIETRLVIPASYDDAVGLFARREVDLAYFGGFTFVRARAQHDAEALVMREIDTRFISWFVTRPEYKNLDLAAFRHKSISFGDRLSTSGHLMPRYFLQHRWQIEPEKYFARIDYSGAHDETVMRVRDGKVDLGAVNSVIVRQMLDSGRLSEHEIHVTWQTPPYPDYVWAVRDSIDDGLKTKLRDAFLELERGSLEHTGILKGMDAQWFLPADPRDFDVLAEVAESLGLTRENTQ